MVNNQEPTSALEKVLLRALAAGLATPLEGARALAQLDAIWLAVVAEEPLSPSTLTGRTTARTSPKITDTGTTHAHLPSGRGPL